MNTWQVAEWSLAVSIFAAVMAMGAFIVGWLAEVRARDSSPYVTFSMRRLGEMLDAGDGQPADVFEFTNRGNAPAHFVDGLMLYGCKSYRTVDHRVPQVLPAGQSVKLLIRSGDFQRAFAVVRCTTSNWARPRPHQVGGSRWRSASQPFFETSHS